MESFGPICATSFLMGSFDNSDHALRVFCLGGAFVQGEVATCGNQQHLAGKYERVMESQILNRGGISQRLPGKVHRRFF
jgi:hypothetical protein